MMGQREKLIELMLKCNADNELFDCFRDRPRYRQAAEILADYLITNGVVVLPCKAGDKVYRIVDMSRTAHNSFLSVETIHSINPTYVNIMGMLSELPVEQFGETVFLTREEAERALEKRKGGDE